MSKIDDLSKYLCYILRHNPSAIGITMDTRGWVSANELIELINQRGLYHIDKNTLKLIVNTDEKNRYEMIDKSEGGFRFEGGRVTSWKLPTGDNWIRCRQGHSIEWIEPDLIYKTPPEFLYHGTTDHAVEYILEDGHISRMKRHAVHMTADPEMAWKSAERWNVKEWHPALIEIKALEMYNEGLSFGVTGNDVWCIKEVPAKYISRIIVRYEDEEAEIKVIEGANNNGHSEKLEEES